MAAVPLFTFFFDRFQVTVNHLAQAFEEVKSDIIRAFPGIRLIKNVFRAIAGDEEHVFSQWGNSILIPLNNSFKVHNVGVSGLVTAGAGAGDLNNIQNIRQIPVDDLHFYALAKAVLHKHPKFRVVPPAGKAEPPGHRIPPPGDSAFPQTGPRSYIFQN